LKHVVFSWELLPAGLTEQVTYFKVTVSSIWNLAHQRYPHQRRTDRASCINMAMAKQYIHFDPFSGISGDMTLGALLDLGLDINLLRGELGKLGISGYQIEAERVKRGGISAVSCSVRSEESRLHRHLHHIEHLISESPLDSWVKEKSLEAFARLAQAESKIHAVPVEKIHFHEVGAIDAIVDVVGSMIGFYLLGVREFGSSAINVGGGQVSCEHGILPVPAPATAELLKGLPIYGDESAGELTTPTGAAILTALCGHYGPLTSMRASRIGYGAGSRITERRPNALRLILGEIEMGEMPAGTLPREEPVIVIEANVDDMSPQLVGYFFDKALEAGALDVFAIPLQMKKGRPGCLLSVICRPVDVDRLLELIFTETTTLGVRYRAHDRATLQREELEVKIPQGRVRVKIAGVGDRIVNAMPEYEDCRGLAEASGETLKVIQARVLQEFMNRFGEEYGAKPRLPHKANGRTG
jgi:pyridinium-3,5-bisthiocarboxylic acid mononucleotide nickel chelatase